MLSQRVIFLIENVCEKKFQYSGEKFPLSSLPAALLKIPDMSLEQQPCAQQKVPALLYTDAGIINMLLCAAVSVLH